MLVSFLPLAFKLNGQCSKLNIPSKKWFMCSSGVLVSCSELYWPICWYFNGQEP